MTYRIERATKVKASVDLVKHRFVGYDGAYAKKDKPCLGISESNGKSGDWITIVNGGSYLLEVESNVTVGQELTAGTDGKAKIATGKDYVHAVSRDNAQTGNTIEAEPVKYKLGG